MAYEQSRRKLEHATREAMIRDSHRGAQANWRAMMREQWGDRFSEPGGEEMINVESPTTITHHHPPPAMSGLAKIALAAAVASGFGVPVALGIAAWPIAKAFLTPTPITTPAEPPKFDPTLYDLRLGKP